MNKLLPVPLMSLARNTKFFKLITSLQANCLTAMLAILFASTIFQVVFPQQLFSQDQEFKRKQYVLDDSGKLNITVHIWGEVLKPGEYVVPDGTNVLELISMAGGPTDFSKLNKVAVTRASTKYDPSSMSKGSQMLSSQINQSVIPMVSSSVLELDIKGYLEGETTPSSIIALHPGDIVRIKRNGRHRVSTAIRIVAQVAVVTQALYWYSRIK